MVQERKWSASAGCKGNSGVRARQPRQEDGAQGGWCSILQCHLPSNVAVGLDRMIRHFTHASGLNRMRTSATAPIEYTACVAESGSIEGIPPLSIFRWVVLSLK
jgi:hypothetical protein